jgi:hypothetical protein
MRSAKQPKATFLKFFFSNFCLMTIGCQFGLLALPLKIVFHAGAAKKYVQSALF